MVWTGLTISPAREEVVDFSYPFWEEYIGILTSTKTKETFFIFRPLHVYVWIGFIGMAVVTAVFVQKLESLDTRLEEHHVSSFTRFDVCLWYTFGAMWNQGNMYTLPDSMVYGAYMGPTWGWQEPGGPHVGLMILAVWGCTLMQCVWPLTMLSMFTCLLYVGPRFGNWFETTIGLCVWQNEKQFDIALILFTYLHAIYVYFISAYILISRNIIIRSLCLPYVHVSNILLYFFK